MEEDEDEDGVIDKKESIDMSHLHIVLTTINDCFSTKLLHTRYILCVYVTHLLLFRFEDMTITDLKLLHNSEL